MQFQDWGEEPFIHYLAEQFSSKGSIVGIGDDCASIPGQGTQAWLVTTDALVEGVHFLKDQIPATDLGYKTVAVNVSDITAMGGKPHYAFLSIALPKTADCTWVRTLMQGIKEACEKWDILLLGGDTVGSKRDIFLNLTLIGSAETKTIKYRHLAQPGDVICVSGHLGDAGGGLKALQEKTPKTENVNYLIHSHFHPQPCPEQGMWLAEQSAVHAMMDLSDGLDCDLKRLIQKSSVGAVIETVKLPLSEPLTRVSLTQGWDPLQLALTGGEDYCLLLSVSADACDALQHAFQKKFGIPLFDIGRITTSQRAKIIYQNGGKVIQTHYANFDHFQ